MIRKELSYILGGGEAERGDGRGDGGGQSPPTKLAEFSGRPVLASDQA